MYSVSNKVLCEYQRVIYFILHSHSLLCHDVLVDRGPYFFGNVDSNVDWYTLSRESSKLRIAFSHVSNTFKISILAYILGVYMGVILPFFFSIVSPPPKKRPNTHYKTFLQTRVMHVFIAFQRVIYQSKCTW